ncbi:high mobility group B protein 13-like [Telopea speciosissima]|uniref:high mobility group B protein 13-like n=1 Tax=Telopea speciosissima TaxID=54955 RepID=UPI001CC52DD1|nr:high mobility group B protein 13-like [Telopea speciosissima]
MNGTESKGVGLQWDSTQLLRNATSKMLSRCNNLRLRKISQSSASPLPSVVDDGKENNAHLSQPQSRKQTKKAKESKQSFEELQEIQGKLDQMRLEKEKTEELLKSFPLVKSLREKEQEKNVKRKKKAGPVIKKPSPTYVLGCRDQCNEVKKENSQSEFKEISNILGSKWKNLSPEEKKPYEEKYQADKEAYLQIIGKEKRENEAKKLFEEEQKQKAAMELLEQYLQFKQEVEKETKKTRKEKDPLKPKQPLSAFFLFSKERHAALLQDNINILEIAKLAGEERKNMAEEQRGPYEEMAKKQKEEYLREMEIYKQKKDEEAGSLHKKEEQMKIQKQEALQLLKKKEKAENIIKKTKENRLKKKKQKEEQNSDPKRRKKLLHSFFSGIFFKKNLTQVNLICKYVSC